MLVLRELREVMAALQERVADLVARGSTKLTGMQTRRRRRAFSWSSGV